MTSTAQEISAIEKATAGDFNAGRVDRLLVRFHPRVVGFSSKRHERISGKAAMRRTFDYYRHASSRLRFRIAMSRVQALGDAAIASFYWTVQLGAGRPAHFVKGRGTHVFARQGAEWLIVRGHFSRAQ